MICSCGCGQSFEPSEYTRIPSYIKKYGPQKYINGHNGRITTPKGKSHPWWNGGKKMHRSGYVYVYVPDHPYKGKYGYVFEHRLVMEKHIGRYLKPSEHIHHINGVKTDNLIENLQILSNSEHSKLESNKRLNEISELSSRLARTRRRNLIGRFV